MMAAGNRAFDKNTHEEREEGEEAVWLVNNKSEISICSKRGRKMTHIRSIDLSLIISENTGKET